MSPKGNVPPKSRSPPRHGHAQQEAVEAGAPCPDLPAGPASMMPDAVASSPQRTPCRPANVRPGTVVAVEAEPPANWPARRKVEDLGGSHLASASSRRCAATAEQWVCLAERTVGQTGPQLGRPGQAGSTEAGLDQRGEELDVGAHDDHVAGLEGWVGRLAGAARLRAPPLPGVHGRGTNGIRKLSSPSPEGAGGPLLPLASPGRAGLVGSDISLDKAEQGGARPVARRDGARRLSRPAAASTSCISRASRPQERNNGLEGNRTSGRLP